MNKFIWIAIIFAIALLLARSIGWEYALIETVVLFVFGLILSPIWRITVKTLVKKNKHKKWKWHERLNAAAYIMVYFFLLQLYLYHYSEDSYNKHQAAEEANSYDNGGQ